MNLKDFLIQALQFVIKFTPKPDQDVAVSQPSDANFKYYRCNSNHAYLLLGFFTTSNIDIAYFPTTIYKDKFLVIFETAKSPEDYAIYLTQFKEYIETEKRMCKVLAELFNSKIPEFEVQCLCGFQFEPEVIFEYRDAEQVKLLKEAVKDKISPEAELNIRQISDYRIALASRYLTDDNILSFIDECADIFNDPLRPQPI